MGLRIRKSVKVAPGVRMTAGRKSASISVGTKGARITKSTTGRKTTTLGVPGTGVSHVSTSSSKQKKRRSSSAGAAPSSEAAPRYSPKTYKVCGIIMLVIAAAAFLIGLPTLAHSGWLFIAIGVLCLQLGLIWIRAGRGE